MIVLGIFVRDTGSASAQNAEPAAIEAPAADTPAQPGNGLPTQTKSYIPDTNDHLTAASIIAQKRAEDSSDWLSRIISIFGIFGFLAIAWLLSNNRNKVKWKLVTVGTLLQLGFGIFILWTPIGKAIFQGLNSAVTVLLNFTTAGTSFMFASMLSGQIESALLNTAMSILPPIIFFSSLMTILYHLGIMQVLVRGMAVVMMRFMGTSGSESLSAVANIFVGQTEAPLVVKPYVAKMTNSELMAIMTGGMATIAGGVMAAYVAMLQPLFPDIAGHIIAASVMSAPAALVVAKIMVPETEESETAGKAKLDDEKLDANAIDAAARGASEGMKLAINVLAMLLAFVAIIAMINFFLGLPSRIKNASAVENITGYLISTEGQMPEKCAHPYSDSDTIQCAHIALIDVAQQNNIAVPEELASISGSQSDKIEKIEKLNAHVRSLAPKPLENSRMVADCRTTHNLAACGAVLTKTQSEYWTPEIKDNTLWPLLSLEMIFGIIFFPIAFLMGIPLSDCFVAGQLLGEKMVLNEFIAYSHLSQILQDLHYRTIIICSYALCGFANFGSIAIQIGGIGGIAPNRRSDIAKLGIKSMIAGSIAAFMTATIAGALVY